jgi:tetratricopeptide (TPR) repeat protein
MAAGGSGIMRRIALHAATAAILAFASSAAAQEAVSEGEADEKLDRSDATASAMGDEAARGHFRVGGILYDEGRFREAAEEFRKAHVLSGKPALHYNMYIAYRDAGLTPQAVEALRRYLGEAPEVPNRRQLEVRLAAMEQTLEGQQAPEESVAPVQAPTPVTTADAEAVTRPSPLPWVLGGLGAGLIVAGTVTGLMALSRTGAIEDACPDGLCPADYPLDRERSRARRTALATDVLLPVGAVSLGVGVLLYFLLGRDGPSAERPIEANASCGPGGCAGELRVRF